MKCIRIERLVIYVRNIGLVLYVMQGYKYMGRVRLGNLEWVGNFERVGSLERVGNLEQPSKSSVSSKLQVKFLVSNASVNWAFNSSKYGWAA